MDDNADQILHSLDGPDAHYPPYDKLDPYPKFLVIDIYGGYTLTSDRVICITDEAQASRR